VRKKFFKLVMAISIALLSGTLATAGHLKPLNPLATLSADTVSGDKVHISSATEQAGAHPYCSVRGFVEPAINFEVRLPTTGWTQRYLQTGCGGLCGMLSIRAEHDMDCTPVTDGSIVLASSDMGHGGAMGDGSWGSDPQKRIDFAHRGMHVTTLVAKALIKAYYGHPQRYAYFSGCSDGGREALIEAQRYPQDFDGIAAGAPALNFTVQNSFYHAWMAKSNMDTAGHAIINTVDLPVLHRVVLAQCDALDGLKDGQVTYPRQCHPNPAAALCTGVYAPGTPVRRPTSRVDKPLSRLSSNISRTLRIFNLSFGIVVLPKGTTLRRPDQTFKPLPAYARTSGMLRAIETEWCAPSKRNTARDDSGIRTICWSRS
jgi:feruloyl esterase